MKLKYIMCEGACVSQKTPYAIQNKERISLLGMNLKVPVSLLDPVEFTSIESSLKNEFLEYEESIELGDMVTFDPSRFFSGHTSNERRTGLIIGVDESPYSTGYYGEYSNSVEVLWIPSKFKEILAESMLVKVR